MKNIKITSAAFFILGAFVSVTAQADVYKCVEPDGHITYTNAKAASKGCKVLSQDKAVSTVPSGATRTPTPSDFPKVGSDTQKARDTDRRKILEQELSTEEANLAESSKKLAEQEAIRNGDEKNFQRVIERLQPFKDDLAIHERNVEALKKEMSKLK